MKQNDSQNEYWWLLVGFRAVLEKCVCAAAEHINMLNIRVHPHVYICTTERPCFHQVVGVQFRTATVSDLSFGKTAWVQSDSDSTGYMVFFYTNNQFGPCRFEFDFPGRRWMPIKLRQVDGHTTVRIQRQYQHTQNKPDLHKKYTTNQRNKASHIKRFPDLLYFPEECEWVWLSKLIL